MDNKEQQYQNYYLEADAEVTIDEDPYKDIPECKYKPDDDGCNPFEMKCDGRCQGAGTCPFNPFSECYNMEMEDYRDYLDERKRLEAYCTEFLNSEEGQAMLKELRTELDQFEKEDRVGYGQASDRDEERP